MRPSALGPGREFDRIRAFLRGVETHPSEVLIGPGDDAAVIAPDLVLSTDLAIEGIHFDLDWITPREAGRRAAACAISDLAAMGAEFTGALASVAIPAGRAARGEAFMHGVRERVEELGGTLLGGDLTRSPGPLFVDVVVVGRAEHPLLRSGAHRGDELWVTGRLGGAAAAVQAWQKGLEPPDAHRTAWADPMPRLAEARWLVAHAGARAGIDLSDGLAGDAAHLAAASGLGIELEGSSVPLVQGVKGLEAALRGGDDYELLVACPGGALDRQGVEDFRRIFDLEVTRIGRVTRGAGVRLRVDPDGTLLPLKGGGYDHFDDEPEP